MPVPIVRFLPPEKIENLIKDINKYLHNDVHVYFKTKTLEPRRLSVVLYKLLDGNFGPFVEYMCKFEPEFKKAVDKLTKFNEKYSNLYSQDLLQVCFHLQYNPKYKQYFYFRDSFKHCIDKEMFLPVTYFKKKINL